MARVIDTTLFGLIRDYFKVYLPIQRNLSPHTIRSYRAAFDAFLEFTKNEKGINLSAITFKMLDKDMLGKFLDSIEAGGCSISTRNQRHRCIKAFFSYAAKVDPATIIHQAEIFKVPDKKLSEPNIVKYMSEKAIKALLAQPNPLTKKGLRDRFILLLLYDTAVRNQELLDFRLCDIRLGKTPTITVQHGKGNKTRDIPLMKQTVEHFENYRQVFHQNDDSYSHSPLFYRIRHGIKESLDSSTIRKLIISYAQSARQECKEVPERVTTHTLRHSRAMHLYQRGMDITLVSQWIGHARLETTLIYAHADTEQKRKAIESATPKNSPLKEKLSPSRFTVDDDETIKRLYGLK